MYVNMYMLYVFTYVHTYIHTYVRTYVPTVRAYAFSVYYGNFMVYYILLHSNALFDPRHTYIHMACQDRRNGNCELQFKT